MLFKTILVGYGNVGRSLSRIICERYRELKDRCKIDIQIVAVVDHKGAAICEGGLDLKRILSIKERKGSVRKYPKFGENLDTFETIHGVEANLLIETTPTNIIDGEPGLSHIKAAIDKKVHIVTSNKGPFVVTSKLVELARRNNVGLKFGATCMDIPSINIGLYALAGFGIQGFRGIFNGTTNYILNELERGSTFKKALKLMIEKGIAETDPSFDIEGYDTACKTVILANTLLNSKLTIKDVKINGITDLSVDALRRARKRGTTIKLVGEAKKNRSNVYLTVMPQEISLSDPLAHVNGLEKAIVYQIDPGEELVVIGKETSPRQTSAQIIRDIINLSKEVRAL